MSSNLPGAAFDFTRANDPGCTITTEGTGSHYLDCLNAIKGALGADPVPPPAPLALSSFTNKLIGPGVWSFADLGHAGDLFAIAFTVGEEITGGSTLMGDAGDPLPLVCGEAKGWCGEIDPATGDYIPAGDFTLSLDFGDCVEVVGQTVS